MKIYFSWRALFVCVCVCMIVVPVGMCQYSIITFAARYHQPSPNEPARQTYQKRKSAP